MSDSCKHRGLKNTADVRPDGLLTGTLTTTCLGCGAVLVRRGQMTSVGKLAFAQPGTYLFS